MEMEERESTGSHSEEVKTLESMSWPVVMALIEPVTVTALTFGPYFFADFKSSVALSPNY